MYFYTFKFIAKITISLTARDIAKQTKIWDHMGSNIT